MGAFDAASEALATNQVLGDLLGRLPEPLAENPTLTIGGAAVFVAATLWQLFVPPARLLNDQALAKIVQDTFLEQKPLVCAYKASRDGWSATAFHEAVDNRGSGVVVAKALTTGAVFGGYNPNGWRSTDDYTTSTTAFLFRGCQQKYPVLPGSPAVFDYATSGPCFGATDLA